MLRRRSSTGIARNTKEVGDIMNVKAGDFVTIPSGERFGLAKVIYASEYFKSVILIRLSRETSPNLDIRVFPSPDKPTNNGSDRAPTANRNLGILVTYPFPPALTSGLFRHGLPPPPAPAYTPGPEAPERTRDGRDRNIARDPGDEFRRSAGRAGRHRPSARSRPVPAR